MTGKARYVIVSVLALAVLAGVMFSHAIAWLIARQGWDDPYVAGMRELPLSTVAAYVLAAGSAIFVLQHGPSRQFSLEVVDELSKVSWPSRDETTNATVVVIATVLACSLYLGAFDAVWLWLTDAALGTTGAQG